VITVTVNNSQVTTPENIKVDADGRFNCTLSNLPYGETEIVIMAKSPNKSSSRRAIILFTRTKLDTGVEWRTNITYNITFNFTNQ
jgi:hypothetical protein